jgi:hypothetical protein
MESTWISIMWCLNDCWKLTPLQRTYSCSLFKSGHNFLNWARRRIIVSDDGILVYEPSHLCLYLLELRAALTVSNFMY